MKILIKTMEGLEGVLAEELRQLHLSDIEIINRGVTCTGNWAQLYKCNYLLRTAIRVLIPIKSFEIKTQDDLYSAVRTIDWSEYMRSDKTTFSIGSTVFGELFTNSQYVTYRVKDAIVDQLSEEKGYRPNVKLDNPHIVIQVHLAGDKLTILMDSSGRSLHLRNYKERAYKAPLNEVMAAGILKLAGWEGAAGQRFVDPMCGSGTFTTEGLMIASNIPAGHFMERFSFQNWNEHYPEIWKSVQEAADAQIKPPECEMHAADINEYAIRDLKKNLQKFPFRDRINIKQANFLKSEGVKGSVLFLNPPYDKRIKVSNVTAFYRDISDKLKQDWQDSTAWVISGNASAMKNFGLKSASKHKLDNGGMPSKLYKFELYAGSKKTKYLNKDVQNKDDKVHKSEDQKSSKPF